MTGPATYDPDYDLSPPPRREGMMTVTRGPSELDEWEREELAQSNQGGGD